MYLKSLEVQGFKSFAHKIKFDFHNGITGIVGPNGSGKSNVSDAVRWVLGEQRARQLRGASMQDVIFAGTENRSPLSAATVSITLDNSDHQLPIDYTEVTVTRRVFRSGESEYLLNGTPCRLKDVNELFYDTGIGKDGYSIIGQGQIDKILSGRPEDRRELFDEAAGIVKFKKRKNEASRKLENERANLLRINDILTEIEHQLGPLERQAEKAREFLGKRFELENFEVNLFLLEMERIKAELLSLDEKGKIAEAEYREATEGLEAIKAEYEKMEEDITALDDSITATREEISNTTVLKGKLENQIKLLEEQIRSADSNDELLKERKDSLEEELRQKNLSKDEYDRQAAEIENQVQAARNKLIEAEDKLKNIQQEIRDCNQGLQDNQRKMVNLLNDRASIKAQQQKFDTMLEQVNIRKAQLNQRLLQKKSDEEDMLKSLNSFKEELSHMENDISVKEGQIASMEQKLIEWDKKERECNREFEEVSISFHKEESRLESLKNLAERYDGYGNSVKKVMEQQHKEKGLIGVVADIISVDKKYEIAIETALGGNIQNIVTTDEDTAKRMVNYLKENRLGRATFLPLTSVSGRPDDKTEKALMEDGLGVLGRADHLVKTDSKFSDIMEYLLCRVIVVDHIDNALKLAKKYQYSLRIVTLEGESLNTGGSLTGGSFKNNSNLLGRGRELSEIEKNIESLKEKREGLKNRLEDIRTAKELLNEDRVEATTKLNELNLAANTARLNVETAMKQKAESDNLYEGLKVESSDIEAEISKIKVDMNNAIESLKDSDKEEERLRKSNEEYNQRLEDQGFFEEESSKMVSAYQVEVAEVEQRIGFVKENQQRIADEIAKATEDLKQVTESARISKEDVTKKKSDIEEIYKTIAAGDDSFAALEDKLKNLTLKKEEMTEAHRGFFQKREDLSNRQSSLDKEIFRLNSQRTRLEESIENQTNHMWDEYELTPHEAEKKRNPNMTDVASMKKDVSRLRDEIKKLVDVNVGAVDEYRELSERYTFMNGQREDLVKAEADLVALIEDLDNGMRKQFKEKFSEIQKEFDHVFKELFGGGKGTLELEEDEDILDCGILIIAQPPGKKLQNMMQLSGGEKALTAICLLFAIQNLKPSPFCLLDEIEAALDDSNVSRFAKYLNKLTENTQFIVITHRRGTMSAADRLYGITMQEKGVSALVSVNLIEEDLDE